MRKLLLVFLTTGCLSADQKRVVVRFKDQVPAERKLIVCNYHASDQTAECLSFVNFWQALRESTQSETKIADDCREGHSCI